MFTLKALALVIAGVVAAGAAVGNALFGPRAKARRRLRRGSAALTDRQIATVVGTVRQVGELLEAPLSGRSCVVYEAFGHVRTVKPGQRYGDRVAEIREHAMVPFELDLGDAVVLVDGTRADLELPPTPVVPRHIESEMEFLIAHGQPAKLVFTSGFDETIVAPGDRIAVQGMVIVELDVAATGERGYREDAPRRLRLVEHEAHPLTIGRARRRAAG